MTGEAPFVDPAPFRAERFAGSRLEGHAGSAAKLQPRREFLPSKTK